LTDEKIPQEINTLTLIDEDGEEHEFEILNSIEIEDQRYVVLAPLADEEYVDEDDFADEGSAVLLKVEVGEDGEEYLTDITDEEEFEMVVAALEAMEEEE